MAAIATLPSQNMAAATVNFVPLVGSAGDGIPARWSATTSGTTMLNRITYDMTTRANNGKDARKIVEILKSPRKDVDGNVLDSAMTVIESTVPNTWSDTQVNEHFETLRTLTGTTGIRDIRASRYAPN